MTQPRRGVIIVPNTDEAPPAAMTIKQRKILTDIEYGVYEAAQRIPTPNQTALAYDVGAPVPLSNVIEHEYDKDGYVRMRDGWEDKVALVAELRAKAEADVKGKGWGPHADLLAELAAKLPELPEVLKAEPDKAQPGKLVKPGTGAKK